MTMQETKLPPLTPERLREVALLPIGTMEIAIAELRAHGNDAIANVLEREAQRWTDVANACCDVAEATQQFIDSLPEAAP